MPAVVYTGWQSPFDKVRLNHLLRAKAGLGLAQAKDVVDRLLEGECPRVEIAEASAAAELVEESRRLGANCRAEDQAAIERRTA